MFTKGFLAVLKQELKIRLFSKTFIIMTLLIPIFMFAILGLQTFLYTFDGEESVTLKVISEDEALLPELEKTFGEADFVRDSIYTIDYLSLQSSSLESYLDTSKSGLLSEKITGIIYIPSEALQNKQLSYYSKNPMNKKLFDKIDQVFNKVLLKMYFEGKDVTSDEIAYAQRGIDFKPFRVSEDEEIAEAGAGNMILSFLFTFLLYFSILFIGQMMMRSVVEEKTNRIVEILLSSVDSFELISGKIIGTAIMGVLQMLIWLSPLILLISSSWFLLPQKFTLSLDMGSVLYFLINYLFGLVTFLGLFAAVGSIFDNEQDTQSGVFPIVILIMIPFFISIALQTNPNNPIAYITSMLPFTAIMVMPARVAMVDVPLWEFVVSLVVNFITMAGIFWVASKVYRIGIMVTGKKPKWSEVISWLKY